MRLRRRSSIFRSRFEIAILLIPKVVVFSRCFFLTQTLTPTGAGIDAPSVLYSGQWSSALYPATPLGRSHSCSILQISDGCRRSRPPGTLFQRSRRKPRLFSCALFRPCGRDFKSRRPRLELLTVSTTATVDADGVGDQLAGFVPAFLKVSHLTSSIHF